MNNKHNKPVQEYIKLRRLSKAIDEFNTDEQRVLDVALDYGFSSHANFTEVFRNRFSTLICSELRMNDYIPTDPRHLCEQLTCDAVTITYNFLKKGN